MKTMKSKVGTERAVARMTRKVERRVGKSSVGRK
jgi:hypothetical protein